MYLFYLFLIVLFIGCGDSANSTNGIEEKSSSSAFYQEKRLVRTVEEAPVNDSIYKKIMEYEYEGSRLIWRRIVRDDVFGSLTGVKYIYKDNDTLSVIYFTDGEYLFHTLYNKINDTTFTLSNCSNASDTLMYAGENCEVHYFYQENIFNRYADLIKISTVSIIDSSDMFWIENAYEYNPDGHISTIESRLTNPAKEMYNSLSSETFNTYVDGVQVLKEQVVYSTQDDIEYKQFITTYYKEGYPDKEIIRNQSLKDGVVIDDGEVFRTTYYEYELVE